MKRSVTKNTASYWLLLLLLVGFSNYVWADEVQDQIARLKDQSWQVRSNAAEALGQLGDAHAVDPLIACLKDENWNVQIAAAHALVKMGKPVVEQLIACLKDQQSEESAAEALGELGDARAVEPLITCLHDYDGVLRGYAIRALGKLGDARAVEPLIVCLKDQQWSSSAAEALSKMGKPAVEPLIACLKDQNVVPRFGAIKALGQLGDARAVEPLIACLKDQRGIDARQTGWSADFLQQELDYLRHVAAEALGKLGKAAFDPLIACLKERDALLRSGAAEALGKTGDARAVKPLITCLKDTDWQVRSQAAEALGSLGGDKVSSILVKALPDWDAKDGLGAGLKKLGWKPTSDSEQVYFWICNSDGVDLKTNWEKTTRVLLADVRSRNQRKIENAVYTFVSLGKGDIVPKLIDILNVQGSVTMAETYLNCGSGELAGAAQSWAAAHGYQVSTGNGANKAGWGRW